MTSDNNREQPEEITEEQKTEILKKTSDAIIEKGIDFDITVANPNILHRLKILKTKRQFIIKPLFMGTVISMCKILITIDNIDKEKEYISQGIESIAEHADKMIEIIAIAITNSEKRPSRILKKFIKCNLTNIEIFELLSIVTTQMRIMEFLQCIVLVKGLNQMEKLTKIKAENAPQNTPISGEQSEQQ